MSLHFKLVVVHACLILHCDVEEHLITHIIISQVPWKLLKKPTLGVHKRVYVCPELSCLHHDPSHALGDLVGIKKHYRRKHCTEKHWKCVKCSKGYAVQSDYKAHLKTCGTRGHCCDCGKVFSRWFLNHMYAPCQAHDKLVTFDYTVSVFSPVRCLQLFDASIESLII